MKPLPKKSLTLRISYFAFAFGLIAAILAFEGGKSFAKQKSIFGKVQKLIKPKTAEAKSNETNFLLTLAKSTGILAFILSLIAFRKKESLWIIGWSLALALFGIFPHYAIQVIAISVILILILFILN